MAISLARASGHERRPIARSLLTARHSHAKEIHQRLASERFTPNRILEVRIPAVNDDVARREVGHQLLYGLVYRIARLDHQQDAARPLQRPAELVQTLCSDHASPGV